MKQELDGKPVRAVIFDVYHTLLAVRDGPAERVLDWEGMWPLMTGVQPVIPLRDFDAACREVVAKDHAALWEQGVKWPEVDWKSVVRRAVPGLRELEEERLRALIWFHTWQQRQVTAMPGARRFIRKLQCRGIPIGIASNAQEYTVLEMAGGGLRIGDFEQDLCFWSFQQGFSKPDPEVFAWLGERLAARGILPEEVMMIGDRLDNDVEPARAAGWRTWHFQGSWPELGKPRRQTLTSPGSSFFPHQ